jgi:hypothetical protein
MKVGDLCWVFEGCIKTLEQPVVFLGRRVYNRGNRIDSYCVMQQDGKRRSLSEYYYTLVRVDDRHIL